MVATGETAGLAAQDGNRGRRMQLFKLIIAMAFFGYLFQDRIIAKTPEAIIAIGLIFAGFMMGGEKVFVRVENKKEETNVDE